MARRRMTLRPGGLVPLPTGAMLLVLFLLPWVQVSCGSREVGTASGLELARGRITVDEEIRRVLGSERIEEDHPEPRPLFWLGAALPALVLLAGIARLRGVLPGRIAGAVLLCLALAGAGVLAAATGVDYAAEADRRLEGGAGGIPLGIPGPGSGDLSTHPTATLWAGLGFYGVIGLTGAAEVLLTGGGPRKRRRR